MLGPVLATLRRGQRLAESLMVDTVTVTRRESVTAPDYTTVEGDVVVYSGRCKVQTYEPDAVVVNSGGRPVTTQEYRLHVPLDAGPFRVGDVAMVEGYQYPFRVDGLLDKTMITAQRLKVTQIPE